MALDLVLLRGELVVVRDLLVCGQLALCKDHDPLLLLDEHDFAVAVRLSHGSRTHRYQSGMWARGKQWRGTGQDARGACARSLALPAAESGQERELRRGGHLTSHEWLMKRAMLPRVVASTTMSSSRRNM